MTRDLDTLLREAVATTPVDTDAVLGRARTIRRRRATGRVVAALAVLSVVGVGATALFDDEPVAPIVSSDPIEVEGALAPVVPGVPVDDAGVLLRAIVEPGDVPDLDLFSDRPAVTAVGPDGTWVRVDRGAMSYGRGPDRLRSPGFGDVHLRTAAVLGDGTIVAIGSTPMTRLLDTLVVVEPGAEPDVRRLDLVDEVEALDLAIVQTTDRVRVVSSLAGAVHGVVDVWSADTGFVDEVRVVTVTVEDLTRMQLGDDVGSPDGMIRTARADGLTLDVDWRGGETGSNGSRHPSNVIGGRLMAMRWDFADNGLAALYVLGPGDGVAAVVPLGVVPDDCCAAAPWTPVLSVDGAVWQPLADGGVRTLVPAGGLPDAPTRSLTAPPQLPAADLPPIPSRPARSSTGLEVVGAGDVADAPSGTLSGVPVHDALPARYDHEVVAVSPSGSVVVGVEDPSVRSGAGRGFAVLNPTGAVERVQRGDVYTDWSGLPVLGFDASGNLWALADRWWSHAGFPDLVVRRPGEGSFTSVGHLPLTDLLDSDAGRVVFHVTGDEVALVAWTTDAAGRDVLAGRVVVARDGAALTAAERSATVGTLPGHATALGPIYGRRVVESIGWDGMVNQPGMTRLSGPFTGAALPGAVDHTEATGYGGTRPARGLPGSVVSLVLSHGGRDAATTSILLTDPAGTAAALTVEGDVQPLVAADGSVWGAVHDDDAGRLVRLLDPDWSSAG